MPTISEIDAEMLAKDGYKSLQKELIAQFQNETHIWVKQAEVHLLQLLDVLVAVPIAVFYLDQSGSWEDVKTRVDEVLLYLNVCGRCLKVACETGMAPVCKSFCRECIKTGQVCEEHTGLFDTWNPDETNVTNVQNTLLMEKWYPVQDSDVY